MRVNKTILTLLVLFGLAGSALARSPAEAVAEFIDGEIAKRLDSEKVPGSPLAGDAEFLRRVYLDLTGHIPPYEEAVAFLGNTEPGKRATLIESLLESPEFGQHFAIRWANLLVGQDTSAKDRAAFENWLAERLNKGESWDKIVSAMLTAEGEPAKEPAAIFMAAQSENNQIAPNLLAAATTRYFLGVQLQCAECHDHPFTEYKQTDFWGIAAFYSKVKKVKASKDSPASGVLEVETAAKANDPDGPFIRIASTAGKASGTVVKARFLEADEAKVSADKPFRPVLAKWLTGKDNKYFARATVNRVWAQLFGRGLVNPVDDMHADNPSIHPELLDRLTEEFKASKFDLKHLIRCITASQTYQRTATPLPENEGDYELFSHMPTKVMSPEVLYNALTRAMGMSELKISNVRLMTPGIGGAKKNAPASPREQFVRFFDTGDADSVATDFTHGIPQALALMNDPAFNQPGLVAEKLAKEKLTPHEAVERLFLTALSRPPTENETNALVAYLRSQPDETRGYAGALWILFNTQEFMLIR